MARGMSTSAGKYAPARTKAEVMQFASWNEWVRFQRWQLHCGLTLVYLSHKRADDGRVFVTFEIV